MSQAEKAADREGWFMSLTQLARLPTNRVLITAAPASVRGDQALGGALGPVGGPTEKAKQIGDLRIAAIAVSAGQDELQALHRAHPNKVLSANDLQGLWRQIYLRLGYRLYGSLEPLPDVLSRPRHRPQDDPSALEDEVFDYRPERFHKLTHLDDYVRGAMSSAQKKGYIVIKGPPASGKTFWALQWWHESERWTDRSADSLPPLDGCFFARRGSKSEFQDETRALQQ